MFTAVFSHRLEFLSAKRESLDRHSEHTDRSGFGYAHIGLNSFLLDAERLSMTSLLPDVPRNIIIS